MNIPENVSNIIAKLEENGFEGFIVGGCVRDYVLGFEPKDFDITTNALPEDIKEIFDHTVDTGIQHGTVTVVIDKENYEVTTYRIDGEYLDNRRPEEVIFTKDIEEDLSRRDFTMNAIAYNDKIGYVDPFFGIQDIKNQIIRGVGDPDKRFKEDALRIMRCVRFSSQLGFKIEEMTYVGIYENVQLLKNISIERIRDEFFKLLNGEYIEKFKLLHETHIYKQFIPEIEYIFENYEINYNIVKTLDPSLRFSFLICNLDENTTNVILKRLKLDNKTIKENKIINKYFNENFIDDRVKTRKFMSLIEPTIFKKIIGIKFVVSLVNNDLIKCKMYDNIFDEIDETIKKNHCYNLKMLDLNGDDLKKLGICNGIDIGKYLKLAFEVVLDNPDKNDKTILIDYIKGIICEH